VVCCTAIGAGSVMLNEHCFSRVLFDEAAQATELATVVPLVRGASQVVLCGDQCQLPPTVSVDCMRNQGLELSLFERLTIATHKPHVLLEAQHRMHPAISAFPRAAFYGGRLMDGIACEDRPAPDGFHWPKKNMPLCFLPVRGREQREGESLRNEEEAQRVLEVVKGLLNGGLEPSEVGIVSPYAAQVRLLKNTLIRAGLPTARDKGGVEINSVDGYQGREKEAIVISTVRSSSSGGLGFVADWRRANVAFTRARRGLVVVGDPETLGRDPTTWAPWLKWVRDTGCYSPPGSLDRLPNPRGDSEAIGLAAKSGDSEKLLKKSAQAWAKEDAGSERKRSRSASSGSSKKRRKLEKKEKNKEKKEKKGKDEKKDEKKEKEEKKEETKEKKDKKEKKAPRGSRSRSNSAGSGKKKKEKKKDKKVKKKEKKKSSESGSS